MVLKHSGQPKCHPGPQFPVRVTDQVHGPQATTFHLSRLIVRPHQQVPDCGRCRYRGATESTTRETTMTYSSKSSRQIDSKFPQQDHVRNLSNRIQHAGR